MPTNRHTIESDFDSRNTIAAVTAFMGAAIGFLFGRDLGLDPVLAAILGFFLSTAFAMYSRGMGLTILLVGAFLLIGVFSGGNG